MRLASFYDQITDVASDVSKMCDDKLMTQLEWLVKRGILIVKKSEGKFLQMADNGKISYHQEIELCVQDKEYIEKLEAENAQLKNTIETFRNVLKGME